MTGPASPALARDPQDLERLLVERQRIGDLDGMVALYEPGAVIDHGAGLARGIDAIRALFAESITSGRKFQVGEQRSALLCGDLALTSTGFADGVVTAEVARRQGDGNWLWVIDRFQVD